jgi:ATP-binding cassette subfamily B protein
VSEHIQEGLDIIQEIKSYGNEEKYSAKLKEHLNNYERELTKGELVTGVLVNSAQSFLKLGLASVIIVGAKLLATGETNLFTYLIFLLVASRIYDPINEFSTTWLFYSF